MKRIILLVLIAAVFGYYLLQDSNPGLRRHPLGPKMAHVSLAPGRYCFRVAEGEGWMRLYPGGGYSDWVITTQGSEINLPEYAEADIANAVQVAVGDCNR